jgi:ribosomal-protein-alanine N-acetyltransferase
VPPFQIVQASWRDLSALRKLEQVCFGVDAWPIFDLIGVLSFPGIVRIKATNPSDELIGFVAGDVDQQKRLGWITTIGVFPAYRRAGIASALLDECEMQMGMPRVRLSVRRSNQPAIDLYEKRGYRLVDVWPKYYTSGEDALVLECKRSS